MIDIKLSIWDLGGQERFDFLKEQFFKGAAVVALVFDLARHESFEKLNFYLKESRDSAGSIPILLVGNKIDLEQDIGEFGEISADEIDSWMRNNQITDFIKTSAKTGQFIEDMFSKLSAMALMNLKDDELKIGELTKDGVFQFKIVLVGAGGVGKTSILYRFTKNTFLENYEMTIGVDFLTKELQLDEDSLPEEIIDKIAKLKKKREHFIPREIPPTPTPAKISEEGSIEKLKTSVPDSSDRLFTVKDESIQEELLSFLDADEKTEEKAEDDSMDDFGAIEDQKPQTKTTALESAKPQFGAGSAKKTSSPPVPGSPKAEFETESPRKPPTPPASSASSIPPAPSAPSEAPKAPKPLVEKEKSTPKRSSDERKKGAKAKKKMAMKDEEFTHEKSTILKRKTTVFYQRQMNPLTHNSLSVILSTEKIYEALKKKVQETRASSDKTLEIKEHSPIVNIEPYFPSCVVSPATIPLDARKESDEALFDVTPLAKGDIDDACVRLYYEGILVDTIPTPTKVVKQTAAKISAFLGFFITVIGPLFDEKLQEWLPFLSNIWQYIGIENFFLILGGISVIISGISYFLKKRKKADPVSSAFPSLEDLLKDAQNKNLISS